MKEYSRYICVSVFAIFPFKCVLASNDELPVFWRAFFCFLGLIIVKIIISYVKSKIEDRREEQKKEAQAKEERRKNELEWKRKEREYNLKLENRRKQIVEKEARIAREQEEKEKLIQEEIRKNRIWLDGETDDFWNKPLTDKERALLPLWDYFMEILKKRWGTENTLNEMYQFFMENLHFLGFEEVNGFSKDILTTIYKGRLCYIKIIPFARADINKIERTYKEFLQFVREKKADGIYIVHRKRLSTLQKLSGNDADIHFLDSEDIHKIFRLKGEEDRLDDKKDNSNGKINAELFPLYIPVTNGFSWEITRWNFYVFAKKYTPQSLYDSLLRCPRISGSFALTDNDYMLYTPVSGRFTCIIKLFRFCNPLRFVIKGSTLENSFIRGNMYDGFRSGRPLYNEP